MILNLYLKHCFTFCLVFLSSLSINAQLHFEGLIFNGMDSPLLENVSSVAVSPDGKHVYSTSYNDNAVSVFERDAVSAAPGSLTFLETKKNEVEGVSGLGGAFSVKVSPDGNHVYIASSIDDAIVVFDRNVLTGELTFLAKYVNGIEGVTGLDGAYSVDIPSDGNHIYVTGSEEHALSVFQRNVITGELNQIQVLEDESGGVTAMNFPLSVAVSPDAKQVYVTSFGDNALNVFSRDLLTGELSIVEAHIDDQMGVDGLLSAYGLFITPDGNQVYVTGQSEDAIAVFNRNSSTGALSFVDAYFDNTNGVDGLGGATSIFSSADGNYLYVTASNEDAVAVFSRDAGTGILSFINMVQEGVDGVNGISYPIAVNVSKDGKNLYVTGFGSASLAIFDIDEDTGVLGFMDAETGTGMGVSGLDGASAAVVSPDGNNVYIAGNNSDAIVFCSRNASTGAITYQDKIEDASGTDGLNGINSIVVSPDGAHVYATGFWDKTVVLFERHPVTGALTYIERYKDGIGGVDGLNGANWVSISPDGSNIYVTGYWEHAVAVFSRNTSTGVLTFQEVHKDGVLGVDGLNRASAIEISSDGKNAYVAGNTDNAIAIFSRNLSDGTLTFTGMQKDGVDGVDGIERITSLVVSSDGMQVYACGFNDDAVSAFDRNTSTGELTYTGMIKNGIDGVVGLNGPSRLTLSNDGEHIYVSTSVDDALVAIRRNLVDGSITYESAAFDSNVEINGLDGAQAVSVSPDGKHMYVSGSVDDAVAIFSCTYILTNQETICEGDSVVVGSSVYHETGVYVDTFSFGACKSVVTLELTVHLANTIIDAEICTGDSYELLGNDYSSTGTYTHELVSSHGCDSTVVLNLLVVNAFPATQENQEICEGDTYVLGTQTLDQTGSYTETFTTAFGCDSVVVLDLLVHPKYETTLTEEICEGEFYVFGTQNYITSGTFVETFQSVNGCDSIVTLELTVHAPYATLDESICEGDGYELGDEVFFDPGTYVVIVETGAGCDSEVTLNLTVDDVAAVELTEEICEGDSYIVGSTEYTESGTYTEVLTAANGCDSTVTLNLTVNLTNVTLDETICEGDEIEFGGNVYTTSGTYMAVFTSTSGCGDSTVVLHLNVDPAEAFIDAMICEGDTYVLGNNTYTETGTYVENVTSDAGCVTAVTLELYVAPVEVTNLDKTLCAGETYTVGNEVYTQSGNYSDVLQTSEGCDSTVNLTLTVLEPITVSETIVDNTGNSSGSISLDVTGGLPPFTYEWSNGATSQDIDQLNGGIYELTITDANGCTEELSFTVDGIDATYDVELPFDVSVYPNPVQSGKQVMVDFVSDNAHSLKIMLYNVVGKLISSRELEITTGNSIEYVSAPDISGLYMIHIIADDGSAKTFELSVQ